MRRFILGLWLVLSLSLSGVVLAQAGISITPDNIAVGETVTVTVTGLTPNTTYGLAVVYVPDSGIVFTTNRTSNMNGQLSLSLTAEPSDLPGTYQVRVSDAAGAVIVAGSFELAGGAQTPPSAPPAQSQPATGNSFVRIIPAEAGAGNTHDILVDSLPADQNVVLEINGPDGSIAYTRTWRSDSSGRLQVKIYTEENDAPGAYAVRVRDQQGNTLGSGTFTISNPIGRDGVLILNPQQVVPGQVVRVEVTEIKPFADLNLTVTSAQTRNRLYFTRGRATVDGTIAFDFNVSEEAEIGQYNVVVTEGANTVATGTLIVQAGTAGASAGLTISPASGPIGTSHTVRIESLSPGQAITLSVVRQADGVTIYSTDRTADNTGAFQIALATDPSDIPGDYTVNITSGATVLASGTLTIEGDAPRRANAVITPVMAEAGVARIVSASGLTPGSQVTVQFVYQGRVVVERVVTADVNGLIAISLATDPAADPGDYDVVILQQGETVATTFFNVQDVSVVLSQQSGVSVTITPDSGDVGTEYTILISGLSAGDQVTINVAYDGRTVFAAERTAAEDGTASLQIFSEPSDPLGEYTVSVVRDGESLSSASFRVGTSVAEEPPATTEEPAEVTVEPFTGTITVSPESGPRGTAHTVTVAGLNPNEQVTFQVILGAAVLYETERTADANGTFEILLRSEPRDASGVYNVVIVREGVAVGQAPLIVTRDGPATTPPTTAAVSVTVDPASGPIGTSHEVTVRGLQPGEMVVLDVLFGGVVEYETERTADASGVITLRLVADESDPQGTYTVRVLRAGQVLASGDLIVGSAPAVTVAPSSAATERYEGRLSAAQPEQTYAFAGEAGEVVTFSLSSNDFDTYLILRDDFGADLIFDDDSLGNLNSRIGPYILPYTGTYTLVVSSYGYTFSGSPEAGAFLLTIERAPELTTLNYGAPTAVVFDGTADQQYFQIEAGLGDVLTVRAMADDGLDTVLRLLGPGGQEVAFDDDSGQGFDPEIGRYVVTVPGTYVVILSTYTTGDRGSVELVAERSMARNLDTGAQIVRVGGKLATDVVTIQGTTGREVQLNVSRLAASPSQLYITVSQGDVTLMSYNSLSGIPSTMSLGFVVPSDGPVVILVESFDSTSSALEFSVR